MRRWPGPEWIGVRRSDVATAEVDWFWTASARVSGDHFCCHCDRENQTAGRRCNAGWSSAEPFGVRKDARWGGDCGDDMAASRSEVGGTGSGADADDAVLARAKAGLGSAHAGGAAPVASREPGGQA